jgi:diaminohydroxyphosphoribosylaminopyrimidine deaminase/5-amino-6-(5-phosphoribosylamino)uracil reductase
MEVDVDTQYMSRALELAHKGTGTTSPNPRVGCVIVQNGSVIAEGYHARYGEHHAERAAILGSAESVAGATAYVTLEPCSHHGKQPPCANLLVESGIRRVVIGCTDPNPKVSGSGIALLRNSGIEVTTGVLEEECRWLNRAFFHHITTGLPYVVVKTALSLDGFTADAYGNSRWISPASLRSRVHALRAELDAVMVGGATIRADNPSLDVRHVAGRNPWRIALSRSAAQIPPESIFVQQSRQDRKSILYIPEGDTADCGLLEDSGVGIVRLPADTDGYPSLPDALEFLPELGIYSVLVESGGTLAARLLQQQAVQEIHLHYGTAILGSGKNAFPIVPAPHLSTVQNHKIVRCDTVEGGFSIILTP